MGAPARRLRWIAMLPLLAGPGAASASWTGVELSLANTEADWQFDGETREAEISQISFQAEEKTATGLRVGLSLGYSNIRLIAATPASTLKFDAQHIGINLHQRLPLGEHFEFYGQLSLRYNSGVDELGDERIEIDWRETGVEFGASLRTAGLRISPYASYTDIDGDISDLAGVDVFDQDEPLSRGLHIDYFVEPSAYVRLSLQGGGNAGGYLSFVRRY